jgi:hypothetical protein
MSSPAPRAVITTAAGSASFDALRSDHVVDASSMV